MTLELARQFDRIDRILAERAKRPQLPAAKIEPLSPQALTQQLKSRLEAACRHRGALIKARSACNGGNVYVCNGGFGECSVSKCTDYHDCGRCEKYEGKA